MQIQNKKIRETITALKTLAGERLHPKIKYAIARNVQRLEVVQAALEDVHDMTTVEGFAAFATEKRALFYAHATDGIIAADKTDKFRHEDFLLDEKHATVKAEVDKREAEYRALLEDYAEIEVYEIDFSLFADAIATDLTPIIDFIAVKEERKLKGV